MSRPLSLPVAGAILLALVLAGPVLAHAELVSSDPEDGAMLTVPPASVSVTFSERLDTDRSRFRLVGPAGIVGVGRVADAPRVIVLDGLTLGPGEYEIQWTAASGDGHIERGKIRFTVEAGTPAPATPAPTAVPGTAAPQSASPAPSAPVPTESPAAMTPGASASPVAIPAEPAGASTGDVLLPIIAALVVVAGAGAFILRRSRRA